MDLLFLSVPYVFLWILLFYNPLTPSLDVFLVLAGFKGKIGLFGGSYELLG